MVPFSSSDHHSTQIYSIRQFTFALAVGFRIFAARSDETAIEFLAPSVIPMQFLLVSCVLLLLVLCTPTLRSQSRVVSNRAIPASRLTGGSIQIDGLLDEPEWSRAVSSSDFQQKEPREGEPSTCETHIRILYDDDALYIGAVMMAPPVDGIRTSLTRRDNPGNSERILISIDSYRDFRTAYTFGVTASGVRIDYYHPEDKEFSRDYSFDPIWEARVVRDSSAWTAELKIPFSQLRFTASHQLVFGLNINRYIPSRNEDTYWVLIPKNETGWSSRFGSITGLSNIREQRRLELLPYVAGSARLNRDVHAKDPYKDEIGTEGNVGFDVKMGLGPNLTLDATCNPDFGQVEADPAEVNLTAYETAFDEKRPFFVEGAPLLKGNGPTYFYSRRIGARPRGSVTADRAHFINAPNATTIIGAAKVSGRLATGLSLAALTAVTAREFAEYADTLAGMRGEQIVEPLSSYNVVRVLQEFGPSASTIGAVLTTTLHEVRDVPVLDEIMNRASMTGGVDWNLRFLDGMYVLSGYVGGSHVMGSTASMIRLQRSSAHFYQRPDAPHVRVDSSRTSLSGMTASLSLSKNSGTHWLWGIGSTMESPGFDLNDLGKLNQADETDIWGWIRYRESEPGPIFHSWGIECAPNSGWDFGGFRTFSEFNLSFSAVWKNFWNTELWGGYVFPAYSNNLSRGGPLMRNGLGWYGGCNLANNYAAQTRWSVFGNANANELGGWSFNYGGSISWKLSSSCEMSFSPWFARSLYKRQYVTTIDDPDAPTNGRWYLFTTIDRSTLATTFRVNYAFTPDLSIELYAEPYAANGSCFDVGALDAPRSMHLRDLSRDGFRLQRFGPDVVVTTPSDRILSFSLPDFTYLSFRSNLVLRWEWHPGSTLYLVWQQNRGSYESSSRRLQWDSFTSPLSASGDHVVALKISYWVHV